MRYVNNHKISIAWSHRYKMEERLPLKLYTPIPVHLTEDTKNLVSDPKQLKTKKKML